MPAPVATVILPDHRMNTTSVQGLMPDLLNPAGYIVALRRPVEAADHSLRLRRHVVAGAALIHALGAQALPEVVMVQTREAEVIAEEAMEIPEALLPATIVDRAAAAAEVMVVPVAVATAEVVLPVAVVAVAADHVVAEGSKSCS